VYHTGEALMEFRYRTQAIERILFGPETDKLAIVKHSPRNADWREMAIYTPSEVAHYLGINKMTLSGWIHGRPHRSRAGRTEPVIQVADKRNLLLSFYNLSEAHILVATQYEHGVRLPQIRSAIEAVKSISRARHPLLSKEFYTDGRDLFIKTVTHTINLSRSLQLGLREVLDLYLERVVRDEDFNPIKIYPMIKGQPVDKVIAIVNGVSSGRPIIDGTGVAVSTIWQRYKAGDDAQELSEDFDIPLDKIKRAIAYIEYNPKAA